MITEIQSFLKKILRLLSFKKKFLPAKFEISTLTFSSFLYTKKNILLLISKNNFLLFIYFIQVMN